MEVAPLATISAFDAKTHFGHVLDRVASGEEIVVTRYDKAVARIVPEGRRDRREVVAAVDGLVALQERIAVRVGRLPPLTDAEVRNAIEEGRA